MEFAIPTGTSWLRDGKLYQPLIQDAPASFTVVLITL